ncbi:MAG TPA: FtsQ-type POTRA domain-containing protein [Solirubrobacteraceae bacterium]|nr:FtsQ-type POTRA domain-containing protein [Solirubrobacteraceae bacterium]
MESSLALRLGRPLRRLPGSPRVAALPRRLRIALLVLLAVLALLGGGWLWFRGSSLVAVRDVRISGVQGVEAARVDAALRSAARGMTTLDASAGALEAAVVPLRVVRSVSVRTSFPHGLSIDVTEQPPVAELSAAGGSTAVAADGVVLGSKLLVGGLPKIHLGGLTPPPGGHVAGAALRAQLTVLGAAPRTLLGWVQRVFAGPEGLTVTMHGGLEIYFGNATRPLAKWLAAARVLADPRSAGATYVDVRLPERAAAGTTAPGGLTSSATGDGQVSASDPTSAALAAVLDEAVAGSSGVAAAPATGTGSGAATGTEASSATGEATDATGAPTATTGEGTTTGETSTTPAG